MPGEQQDASVQKFEKALMKVLVVGTIWCIKWQWKVLMFTGLWLTALILMLDINLRGIGVPGDIWGLPYLGSLGFAVYKTTKNLKARKNATKQLQHPAHVEGVFFGTTTFASQWGVKQTETITKPLQQDGHVLVVGGAGSGKSSCIAIPTLRDTWKAPALVVDIKGELLAKSHRRGVYVFNPLNTSALGYDPFYMLKQSVNPIPDVREIALTLVPMSPDVKDPFWIQAGQNILTGHLLFAFKHGAPFIHALQMLQRTDPATILRVASTDADAKMFLMQYAGLKMETLAGIMAELSNQVMAFATDPHIQATLSKKDIITPQLLEQGYDIFLEIPEYKLEQWRPLISLIVQQFSRHFEQRPDYDARPILFMLDEFPRLGKMETIVHGLATLRSKKVTIMPIIQSLAQLDAIYGHDQRKVIADNCGYKAILGATDADSQQYLSRLVGTEERVKVTKSYDEEGWFGEMKGVSKTTEEKPIIKPEEFAYLQYIALLTPFGFKRVQKVPYYLSAPPPPVAAPVIQQQIAPQPVVVAPVRQPQLPPQQQQAPYQAGYQPMIPQPVTPPPVYPLQQQPPVQQPGQQQQTQRIP